MITQQNRTLPACLWMQAGVVKKKYCRAEFQCASCRYDKALRKVCQENQMALEQTGQSTDFSDDTRGTQFMAGKQRQVESKKARLMFWKDRLRMQPLSKRPCIHHMKGHIDFKTCPKSYHCVDCEFDQYFHDQFKVYTVLKPVGYKDISGVSLPVGYYLHKGHTWLKVEDQNHVRIGLDDFATRLLGAPDQIQALLMGKQATMGLPAFSFFRDGNAASFPSPVDGVVTEVNTNLKNKPELVNQQPYTDGWIMILYCPDLRKNLKQLMFMDSATGFVQTEVDNLYTFLEQETGLMAADGGSLGNDLYGNLPDLTWDKLISRFLCSTP